MAVNEVNANKPIATGGEPAGEQISSGQLFNIFATLNNHTTEKQYQVPTRNITQLVIEENILDWPFKGYLVYSNQNESTERNLSDDAWFYRMDARDEIRIQIKLGEDKQKETYIEGDDVFPKEIWEIDLDFVIYDTEDIPSANITEKAKKVYFWDKRYQMMMDKKMFWSTTTAQKLKGAAHLSDEERSMSTGGAIAGLLIDSGYEDDIDFTNWDFGASDILYTSPTNNSVADDLTVLLQANMSHKYNDVCIFKYNNRLEKKFQLIPLHTFFENAGKEEDSPGPWQLEHFFFENVESEENNTTPYRAPWRDPKQLSFTIDIQVPERNLIASYEFTDMAGIDNSKALVSKPVYSFSFHDNQFNMDYADHEIEKVRDDFKGMYTDHLLPAGKATPIFTLNESKTNQINVEPQFVYSHNSTTASIESRLKFGRNKILFGGFIFNEFIKFRVSGSPHRTAGKFIGIDRQTSDETLKFDNKICGQWFVTNVKHIWNQNRYVNDIQAVKVHMASDNNINEEIE